MLSIENGTPDLPEIPPVGDMEELQDDLEWPGDDTAKIPFPGDHEGEGGDLEMSPGDPEVPQNQ